MAVTATAQVTKSAASYDLTDLPTAKDELGIKPEDTAHDSFLKRAITQTSAAIANYCGRVFQVETLAATFDIHRDAHPWQLPGGTPELALSRYPVIAILSVTENALTLVEGTDFRVAYKTGIIYRLDVGGAVRSWPAATVVVTYQAGFTVDTNQGASVPASPYTVTVTNAGAFALDKGVTYANGTALVPVASAPAHGQYAVAAGVYTFNAADAAASVIITYAYQSIPADLVDAMLRLITARYKAKGRDPMLMSHDEANRGTQRFWVGSQPGQNGAFPPEISGMLDNYRVPVVA